MGEMLVVLMILGAAMAVGFALRGTLGPFTALNIHWWGAAALGLGLLLALPHLAGATLSQVRAILALSYVLLLAFTWVNRRLPAMPVIVVGLVLNALVVVANAGMPVSADAARVSGVGAALPTTRGGPEKHHLMTDEDVLRPLGDVIPVPPPLGALFSPGDVFLYGGLAWLVVAITFDRVSRAGRARYELSRH